VYGLWTELHCTDEVTGTVQCSQGVGTTRPNNHGSMSSPGNKPPKTQWVRYLVWSGTELNYCACPNPDQSLTLPAPGSTPTANSTPGVSVVSFASPPVRPVAVYLLPLCPVSHCPPSVAAAIRGMLGCGLQGVDDHNPPTKWAAEC